MRSDGSDTGHDYLIAYLHGESPEGGTDGHAMPSLVHSCETPSPSSFIPSKEGQTPADGADVSVVFPIVSSTMPRMCRRCQPTYHEGTTGHAKNEALKSA